MIVFWQNVYIVSLWHKLLVFWQSASVSKIHGAHLLPIAPHLRSGPPTRCAPMLTPPLHRLFCNTGYASLILCNWQLSLAVSRSLLPVYGYYFYQPDQDHWNCQVWSSYEIVDWKRRSIWKRQPDRSSCPACRGRCGIGCMFSSRQSCPPTTQRSLMRNITIQWKLETISL